MDALIALLLVDASLQYWPAVQPDEFEFEVPGTMWVVAKEEIPAGAEIRIDYEDGRKNYWHGPPPPETSWRSVRISPPRRTESVPPAHNMLGAILTAIAGKRTLSDDMLYALRCIHPDKPVPLPWEGEDGGDARIWKLCRLLMYKGMPRRGWGLLATHVPGRSGQECYHRWDGALGRPALGNRIWEEGRLCTRGPPWNVQSNRQFDSFQALLSRVRSAARWKRGRTARALLISSSSMGISSSSMGSAIIEEAEREVEEEQLQLGEGRWLLLNPPPAWALQPGRPQNSEHPPLQLSCWWEQPPPIPMDEESLYVVKVEALTMEDFSVHVVLPSGHISNGRPWLAIFPAPRLKWMVNYGKIEEDESSDWRQGMDAQVREISQVRSTWRFHVRSTWPDGEYLVALMMDVGWPHSEQHCAAASERLKLTAGRLISASTTVSFVSVISPIASAVETRCRSHRRVLDIPSEGLRELFVGPSFSGCVRVTTGPTSTSLHTEHIISRAYSLVDQLSYLDWGLTSSHEVQADEPRRRSAVAHRDDLGKRRAIQITGMGGGTIGSEAYFELTIGAVAKVCGLLQRLRTCVLGSLGANQPWSPMFELNHISSFLDVGSGYGKVVLQVCAMARPRVAHGMECVRSRHTIAEAALSELRLNVKTADAPHVSHIRRSVMRTAAPPLDPVAFMHCDATARECLAYSHIFMSDSSFSSLTLCKLALVSTRLPHMEENSLLLLTGACHAA